MTTEVGRGQKILTYDGDCPMCLSTVALLVRSGLVDAAQARSNHDLSEVDLGAAEAAGIRNQLVVIDPVTRETRAGADALLWIIGENKGYPLWVRLASLPGIRHVIGVGYQVISYNRRVISPPRHRVRCDCEPEVTLGRRLSLVVPLAVLAVGFTGLFGAAVFYGWNLGSAAGGAGFMLLAAGVGWLSMTAAGAIALRGEQRIDYISNLVVTAFVGALVLVPAGVLAWWLPPVANVVLTAVSVSASFALMFSMQRRRTEYLGLPARWLWAWVIVVVLGLAAVKSAYFVLGLLPWPSIGN